MDDEEESIIIPPKPLSQVKPAEPPTFVDEGLEIDKEED